MKKIILIFLGIIVLGSVFISVRECQDGQGPEAVNVDDGQDEPKGPAFNADSAYYFCQRQCDFGPRTMNSDAHEKCGAFIAETFRNYGLEVTEQKATMKGYDGTPLKATNIIASYNPQAEKRMILCAHWDSRPWADNDPDEANQHKPVMAANDGASGVAVMLETARLLAADTTTFNYGIDFICFDAEDWGAPQWSGIDDTDSWALGAQHWAANPHKEGYKARFAVLLDMVGGQGSVFYQEQASLHYAAEIVQRVWKAARTVGYGSLFPTEKGGWITDDHIPLNDVAGIPAIDIIPYYPDCRESSFGPTWHTINDDMNHIDKGTLKAVGQTIIQLLYTL